ncbi:hypothetical protein KCU93_g362, partial [Aureobasidium melanogenum]
MADHNQWVESRAQELQDDLEKSQQTITELRRQLAAKDREIKGLEYEVIELDELRQSAEAERNTSRKAQEQLRQQLRQLQMQQPHLRPDETSPVPIADHRSARHDDTFPETNHGASVPYCSRKSLAPNCVAKSSGEEQSRPNSQIRENLDYKRNAKQRTTYAYTQCLTSALTNCCTPLACGVSQDARLGITSERHLHSTKNSQHPSSMTTYAVFVLKDLASIEN